MTRLWSMKGIKPVHPQGNQPWIFIGRTDGKAEVPILWPPDAKNRLSGKDPDAGKDWGQEEKRATEDEMVEWHHWLNGHEFQQTQGDSKGQRSLMCCSSWTCKEVRQDWATEQQQDSGWGFLFLFLPCLWMYSFFTIFWKGCLARTILNNYFKAFGESLSLEFLYVHITFEEKQKNL